MLTDADSAEVRRLRANPSVELVACDARVGPRVGATTHRATASLLDEEGTARALAAYERKHGSLAGAIGPFTWLQRSLLRRGGRRIGVALHPAE